MIKTGLACFTLVLGWFIGQRIIAYWDIRKKRQELDIVTATQFHKLYGEFKEVSRLWRAFSFTGNRSNPLTFPNTTRLDLLKRATALESSLEAIIVKLATERVLKEDDINTLGLFRQAYQELRVAIRGGEPLDWIHGTPEYILYNDLASKVAYIISSNKIKRRPSLAEAPKILRKIINVRPEQWRDELNRLKFPTEGKGVS